MIIAQKATIGLAKGGQPYQAKSSGSLGEPVAPTLADAEIDKKLSARSQKLARLSEPERAAHLAAVGQQATSALKSTTVEKRQRRATREAELGAKQLAWPTKIFGVIYADPPWRFEPYSRDTVDRAADNHYPTMTSTRSRRSMSRPSRPRIACCSCGRRNRCCRRRWSDARLGIHPLCRKPYGTKTRTVTVIGSSIGTRSCWSEPKARSPRQRRERNGRP